MQLSQLGKEFLMEREGFRDEAYQDSKGVWTIGYGTTRVDGKPVVQGMSCTKDMASAWFEADTTWAQAAINTSVKVKLTQNMFDALVSLVYNIGEHAFKTSTLLRVLNVGNYKEAAEQFLRWKFSGGKPVLLPRRKLERLMFLRT